MTDIREAVARAICVSLYCENLENYAYMSDVTRELCRETADAAIAAHIEAIMVPSDAIKFAGGERFGDLFEMYGGGTAPFTKCDIAAVEIWQAMLTAMTSQNA